MDIPRTGPRLKSLFRLWGVTQTSVAEELGIGQHLLSHIVKGRAALTNEQVSEIGKIIKRKSVELEVGLPPFGNEP